MIRDMARLLYLIIPEMKISEEGEKMNEIRDFNRRGGALALRARALFLIFSLGLITWGLRPAFANDIAVENVSLVDQDTVNNTYDIQFDMAWDNSWRITGAPSSTANWDAAWVFAKYSVYSGGNWGAWTHCKLSPTDANHYAPSGSTIDTGPTGSYGMGIFIYRSSTGSGSVNWDNVEIMWDYGADSVADNATVKVRVFTTEMVYIPQGDFYVGDIDDSLSCNFQEGGTTSEFQITSENAITVSDTTGNLYYDASGCWAGDQSGTLEATFPKGYNDFYLMKHEISQAQYSEFLNTLPAAQQDNRHYSSLYYDIRRNYIKKTSDSPAFFGCDANNNAGTATAATKANLNESNDGEWLVCNFLSFMDILAYADWAGLRPFTELEFEKAARGPLDVVDNEYAWGTVDLESATTSLSNAGTKDEVPNQGNCHTYNSSPIGVYRAGVFADASSTREQAGAGYYGNLALSGSVWEKCVTVGTTEGRDFTGLHGDGALRTTDDGWKLIGDHNVTNWPLVTASEECDAASYRGGTYDYTVMQDLIMADRRGGSDNGEDRSSRVGGRLARTAPD